MSVNVNVIACIQDTLVPWDFQCVDETQVNPHKNQLTLGLALTSELSVDNLNMNKLPVVSWYVR